MSQCGRAVLPTTVATCPVMPPPRREPHHMQTGLGGSRGADLSPVPEDSGVETPQPLPGSVHSYTRRGPFPLGWAPSPVRIWGEDGGKGQGSLRGPSEARAVSEQPILACRASISGSGRTPQALGSGWFCSCREEGPAQGCTGEAQNWATLVSTRAIWSPPLQ